MSACPQSRADGVGEQLAGERLAGYFLQNPLPGFSDAEIQDIAFLLQGQQERWSHVPRTYIVLRIINRLDLLNSLLDVGFTDHWFPVTPQALPPDLQPSVRNAIVKAQSAILTQSIDLEKGPNGNHGYYRKGDVLPFRILGKLGGGGHGQVDRIQSSISMKQYALKRIRRRVIYGNKTLESHKMFISEMNIIKSLKHHHMVDFVGSYTDATFLGLIMAPVADMNLFEFLERISGGDPSKIGQTSDIATLRTFFGCLASALQYLHDQSVRHRDIKPQNILVESGNVLFTDFGLSKDYSGDPGSTTSGVTANTPRYAAPEVSNYDPRNTSADVWSLGCVFLEMAVVLKGYTLAFAKEFYSEHGTERTHFSLNQSATAQIIEMLTCRNQHDNKPLGIIKNMLNDDRRSRPTAAQVFTAFVTISPSDTLELITSFCGICCLVDEEHDSHDSLYDDPDISTSVAQQAYQQSSTGETGSGVPTVGAISELSSTEFASETSSVENFLNTGIPRTGSNLRASTVGPSIGTSSTFLSYDTLAGHVPKPLRIKNSSEILTPERSLKQSLKPSLSGIISRSSTMEDISQNKTTQPPQRVRPENIRQAFSEENFRRIRTGERSPQLSRSELFSERFKTEKFFDTIRDGTAFPVPLSYSKQKSPLASDTGNALKRGILVTAVESIMVGENISKLSVYKPSHQYKVFPGSNQEYSDSKLTNHNVDPEITNHQLERQHRLPIRRSFADLTARTKQKDQSSQLDDNMSPIGRDREEVDIPNSFHRSMTIGSKPTVGLIEPLWIEKAKSIRREKSNEGTQAKDGHVPNPLSVFHSTSESGKRPSKGWVTLKKDLQRLKGKGKKAESPRVDSPKVDPPGRVFGVSMRESIDYANLTVYFPNEQGRLSILGAVPTVVASCCIFLKEKAVEEKNLFSDANVHAQNLLELKETFDSPPEYGLGLNWAKYTIYDVANTLLNYLNDLPEPLIPLRYYDDFLEPLRQRQIQVIGTIETKGHHPLNGRFSDTIIRRYEKLITEMPPLERQVLLYFLEFLAVFASKSNSNRLTTPTLASLFQRGILFNPSHQHNPAETRLCQDVLILIIENRAKLVIGI